MAVKSLDKRHKGGTQKGGAPGLKLNVTHRLIVKLWDVILALHDTNRVEAYTDEYAITAYRMPSQGMIRIDIKKP